MDPLTIATLATSLFGLFGGKKSSTPSTGSGSDKGTKILQGLSLVPGLAGIFTGSRDDKLTREAQTRDEQQGQMNTLAQLMERILRGELDDTASQALVGLNATQMNRYTDAENLAGIDAARQMRPGTVNFNPSTGMTSFQNNTGVFNTNALSPENLAKNAANFNDNLARATGGQTAGLRTGDKGLDDQTDWVRSEAEQKKNNIYNTLRGGATDLGRWMAQSSGIQNMPQWNLGQVGVPPVSTTTARRPYTPEELMQRRSWGLGRSRDTYAG